MPVPAIRRRYFSAHPRLSEFELERFTTVDHHDREALVAVVDGEIIGVARYERTMAPTDAEVAFVIADLAAESERARYAPTSCTGVTATRWSVAVRSRSGRGSWVSR